MKLTAKQARFCEEYLIDFNGYKSAIRAGYAKRSATEQATRMLRKDHIIKYLNKLKAETAKRNNLTIDEIVSRINKISLEGEEDKDKLKANDMLMKYLGGYNLNKEEETKQGATTIVYNVLPKK